MADGPNETRGAPASPSTPLGTHSDRHRFSAHLLLREIGDTGQRALSAAQFTTAIDPAGTMATLYLEAAGCSVTGEGTEGKGDGTSIPFPAALPPDYPEDLAVAANAIRGTLGALSAIRTTVGLSESPLTFPGAPSRPSEKAATDG